MPTSLLSSNRARLARGVSMIAAAFAVAAAVAACSDAADTGGLDERPASGGGGSSVPQGSKSSDGNVTRATGLPCDVAAVLTKSCQTCHSSPPQYGAGTALVTWDDLQKVGPGGKKVYELLQGRVHDATRPMPPSPQPKLSEQDLATLDGWIAGGAKPSSASCTSAPAPDGVKPLSCTPDTVLKATKPFTMQPGSPTDQYTCFGVDVHLSKKRHVTALAPKVDNKSIVHHILLFQTSTAVSTEPFACAAFGSASWKLVAGWAPGGQNLELPPEAGFPEEAGTTHWVVQVHYNNSKVQTGVDQSGYELCTTETLRQHDAGVVAFGSTSFSIPPRSTTTIRCDYALGPQFANVKMFNASPHMHTRGASLSTQRLPGGNGAPETILDQKAFSFEAQGNFPITKSATTGDVMRTRCTWKNPGDTTLTFGEGTADEMCFDFVGYYPNIPDQTVFGVPLFTWVTPSLNAACSPE